MRFHPHPAFGRVMIEETKNEVQSRYTTENGYDYDAQVIYGDTDSVMVKFGHQDIETCMKLGRSQQLCSPKLRTPSS